MSQNIHSSSSRGSSSTSRFRGMYREEIVHCMHGYELPMQTSWTPQNPGRRFMACPIRGSSSCGFFVWCDPVIHGRPREVVDELLEKIENYKNEIEIYKGQYIWMKKIAMLISLMTIACLLWLFGQTFMQVEKNTTTLRLHRL